MTISDLKSQQLIIYECITGSRAYGTHLPHSDTDIKGIFIQPKADFYGMTRIEQVNDATNDTVYYELGRFVELLYKNNPNLLEMLNVPTDCLKLSHSVMQHLRPELFLSKRCKDTFAGYAFTQIRKARGLNKKIVNPIAKERKNILAFCYVVAGQGAMPVTKWLEQRHWRQENCGLVNIPHMKDMLGLFYDETGTVGFKGIMQKESSNAISLSSIPKEMGPVTYLHFNQDGYKKYCKDYREYWDWVEKRNEHRYENTISHGKNYDSKNMMHTFRLLDMAAEIAEQQKIIVRRPNREFLLRIRNGEFEYDDLVKMAEEKATRIAELYEKSNLPDEPDKSKIEALLVQMRQELYDM